jgi:hypothetical protein
MHTGPSNGNATPTDVVDAQTALTCSQQRFFSASYNYLAALARLDYALGQQQNTLPTTVDATKTEELPVALPLKLDESTPTSSLHPNPLTPVQSQQQILAINP